MATSLLEAVAAIGLQALLLASLVATLAVAATTGHSTWDLHAEAVARRQVEHLVLEAFARAGRGPSSPGPLALARADELVVVADLDGDGSIDARSTERTAFLIRRDADGRPRLLHRIGRQSMTISTPLRTGATFAYLTARGARATSLDRIRLVEVPIAGGRLRVAVTPWLP
jgi:hypothetical protein